MHVKTHLSLQQFHLNPCVKRWSNEHWHRAEITLTEGTERERVALEERQSEVSIGQQLDKGHVEEKLGRL